MQNCLIFHFYQVHQHIVNLSPDLSEITIDENIYGLGDHIAVYSILSQENICGCITAISYQEIIIRTNLQIRISILIGHIKSGRVIISKDLEALENSEAMRMNMELSVLLKAGDI